LDQQLQKMVAGTQLGCGRMEEWTFIGCWAEVEHQLVNLFWVMFLGGDF